MDPLVFRTQKNAFDEDQLSAPASLDTGPSLIKPRPAMAISRVFKYGRQLSVTSQQQTRVFGMSRLAFTVCIAVWTIFLIIGVQSKNDLRLSEKHFGLLAGIPILTGSLSRVFKGIWTDQQGGRSVYVITMLAAVVTTIVLSYATSYVLMLIAALVVLAAGSFAVCIAYFTRWHEKDKQGTALAIFGAGNVGAAVTNFTASSIMVGQA